MHGGLEKMRRGMKGDVQEATRSFAGRESAVSRSSLLSNLLAQAVFRGKIDYGRIKRARVAKR